MQNDIDLVKQLHKGNRLVFRQIFERYYPALRAFTRKYIDLESVSEDMVQEAFLALWQNRTKIENTSVLKSYLYTATRNNCLNYLRHENVKNKNAKEINYLESEAYFEESLLEEEVHKEVYEAIKALSPQTRKVVLLSMEGLTNPDIAEELEVSVNTVKTLKKRAYQSLREKLGNTHWILLLLLI